MLEQKTVAWFSSGVSSAVATKLIIDEVDLIIYQHIDDQHEDTMRFVRECEEWFGKPILIQQSPYKCVDNACRGMAYVNGVHGAACTRLMKRRLRQEWESENRFFNTFRYVWGFDNSKREKKRAEDRKEDMKEDDHIFPLIDKELSKQDAHAILARAGIKRPMMYDLGYPNNNCVGCVKGGMGYWNKIRIDFPEVFASRAQMERDIGHSCINGCFLDELDPERGRDMPIILEECGAMCERYSPHLTTLSKENSK